jgi:lipopolysaccharide/colanic/teichoic acid biosynthesis glycosyltransferase
MKRAIDLLLSLMALVLLAPFFLLVACAVVIDSGWPVFFKQQRVGLIGREFGIFKFRSMQQNAASSGPYFTQANDVRITQVGQFLRRTSIDELPQLINVLVGDMSLVGPRPDVPAQKSLYSPEDWALRSSVRPGITGLAQVKGRSAVSFEQRLALDLDYAKNVSIWCDIQIMWWTLWQLSGRHAN